MLLDNRGYYQYSGLTGQGADTTSNYPPTNMVCPEMEIRYWKDNCIMRQQKGGGCYRTTCKTGLEISGFDYPVKSNSWKCECGSKISVNRHNAGKTNCRKCEENDPEVIKMKEEKRKEQNAKRNARRKAKRIEALKAKLAELEG